MTEILPEQMLRSKIAELESANSMLADFAALVSHDIRSALRRVLSYAELLAVVPTLNAQVETLNCVHAIMFAARRIQFIADGALASPPQPQSNRPYSSATVKSTREQGQPSLDQESQLNDLRRINRELTDFADSVARGLRTPLGQILSGASRLGALPAVTTNPVSRDMTQEILAGAKEMQRLVDDYLSFANAERHTIYRCRISLESLVQLVRHELEPFAADRNVMWRIGRLPEVEADVSMLRQVLVNLLSNSLKFTHNCPKPVIEIGAQPDPKEHTIYVRDNGIGFDLESGRNLFQKFGRLHTDGIVPGLGIGLVIVKHIIQRHNGRVWAESVPGGGATFYFTLPFAS
jgi:light-regulated signal transduction histidine kinase (bacteriophytochrome)